jgi:RNA polymerase sigma factor (TIGR02999 family)
MAAVTDESAWMQSLMFVVFSAPVADVTNSPDLRHTSTATVGALIHAAEHGDEQAASALFSTLYAELHRMARRELARPGAAVTLSATTLLHEAYIALADPQERAFPDRARFMAYASRVMRGLIIDHARRRQAIKRGGGFELTTLDTSASEAAVDEGALAQIGDALDVLSQQEPELAQVVDLKFFCGFSFAEIAVMRNVSERTIQRQWEKARIFLYRTLNVDSMG